MVGSWEVDSWSVDIDVLQQRAHALDRFDVLAELPLELSYREVVLLQLSVEQEEVTDQL